MKRAWELAEAGLTAANARGCADAFTAAAIAAGASYVQARRYRRPGGTLTAERHWAADGVLSRHTRRPWIGRPSSDYVCFTCNPLLEPVRRGVTRFRFSDWAPRERRFGDYWDAMSEGSIGDAVAVLAYGSARAIASFHVGFDDAAPAVAETEPFADAAAIVAERLLRYAAPAAPEGPEPSLSPRERDAIAYVAEGKTDWEIGVILGVSEATARFHVDNARKKLGAVNRAHAVAKFLAAGLP